MPEVDTIPLEKSHASRTCLPDLARNNDACWVPLFCIANRSPNARKASGSRCSRPPLAFFENSYAALCLHLHGKGGLLLMQHVNGFLSDGIEGGYRL